MEYNVQTGTLQCNFDFMQLKKIKRSSERRAAEAVNEEKFAFALLMVFQYRRRRNECSCSGSVCMHNS